jgi:hypothetical protein
MMRFLSLHVLLALVVPGASLAGQTLSPGERPFATWTDTLPYRRGLVVWVRNTSSDTLTTVRVTVDRCLNIGAGCATHAVPTPLAPHDSAPIVTIRPRTWDDRYVYALSWEWEARSYPPAAAVAGPSGAPPSLNSTSTLPLRSTIRAQIPRRGPGWHLATVQETTDGCFVAFLDVQDDPRGPIGAHLRAIGALEIQQTTSLGFPIWVPVNLEAVKAAQPRQCASETGLSGG